MIQKDLTQLISTSTGLRQQTKDETQCVEHVRMLELYREAGFNAIDFGFDKATSCDYVLQDDNWEETIEIIAEAGEKLGLLFYQCHLPYIKQSSPLLDYRFNIPGFAEKFEIYMERAILASARMGVKWAAVHPLTFPEYNYSRKVSLAKNHEYFDRYVELAKKHGLGIAFENQLPSLDRTVPEKYCQHYEDLIEFVDSYHDSAVSICWDTGHANLMKFNQKAALLEVGKRLSILHINDNYYGARDEHLLPFHGTIPWQEFLEALYETGYEGPLNYESGEVFTEEQLDAGKELLLEKASNCRVMIARFNKIREKVTGSN